jgi:hypothetical protein
VASRTDGFTRHLIREFLSFATGRHLQPADEIAVEDILPAVQRDGYGLRTLPGEALASEIIRSR